MTESMDKKMEGTMELSGFVLDRQEAEERLKRMGTIIRAMLTDMEKDDVIVNIKWDYATFLMNADPEKDIIVSSDLELVKVSAQLIEQMRKIHTTQAKTVDTDMFRTNPYVRGMYSGMEVLMSVFEERDAMLLSETGDFYKMKRGK